jgi:hypothetical protein
MLLGGRQKMKPETMAELRELWALTLGLEDGFSSSAELPPKAHYTTGVLFYFDIKICSLLLDVKGYIPVLHYGKDDDSIASGLTTFLEKWAGSPPLGRCPCPPYLRFGNEW